MESLLYYFLCILSNNIVTSNPLDCHLYQKWTGDDPDATKLHDFHTNENDKFSVFFTWTKINSFLLYKNLNNISAQDFWPNLIIKPNIPKLSSSCTAIHIHPPNNYAKYPFYDWKDYCLFFYYLWKPDAMFMFWLKIKIDQYYHFWRQLPSIVFYSTEW